MIPALWENFWIIERLKYRTYLPLHAHAYYWRTYQQQEIDLVEDYDGRLQGYECKWSTRKTVKAPSIWSATYKNAGFQAVNLDNYLDFVLP